MSALVRSRSDMASAVRQEGATLVQLGQNIIRKGSSVSGVVSCGDQETLMEYLNDLCFSVARLVHVLDVPVPAIIEHMVQSDDS